MLKGLRPRYEAHHKVKITDEAIEAAAQAVQRYITDRFLPDKAIDLIDEAASKLRIDMESMPPEIKEMKPSYNSFRGGGGSLARAATTSTRLSSRRAAAQERMNARGRDALDGRREKHRRDGR